MATSFFRTVDESAPEFGRYQATEATAGPWSLEFQHGGPPSALLVRAAERLILGERPDMLAVRIAVEFVGPVPVSEVTTSTRLVRKARTAALVEATLQADGRDCLTARIWFVRDDSTLGLVPPLRDPELPPDLPNRFTSLAFPYAHHIDSRYVSGEMGVPGPAVAWMRGMVPVVEGAEPSGLAQVALVADSASGISAELDWAVWSFVNVDLDLHLLRPLSGEWVLLDAVTELGTTGAAMTRALISDGSGRLGASLQTLVVSPLRR